MLACLLCHETIGFIQNNPVITFQVVPVDLISKLCKVMIESGCRYVAKTKRMPLMYAYYKTEYLGKDIFYDTHCI